jgi:hypothetical protein
MNFRKLLSILFLSICSIGFATEVEDDLIKLETLVRDFYSVHGRFYFGEPTPKEIPEIGTAVDVKEISKAYNETEKLDFTPISKDFQFSVYATNRKDVITETPGRSLVKEYTYHTFIITAKRFLDSGTLETYSRAFSCGEGKIVSE